MYKHYSRCYKQYSSISDTVLLFYVQTLILMFITDFCILSSDTQLNRKF